MAITSKIMNVGIVPQDYSVYIPAVAKGFASVTSAVSLNGATYGTGVTLNTQDNNRYLFLGHPDASDSFAIIPYALPNNYANGTSLSLTIVWTAAVTTGNVRYNIGVSKKSSTGTYTNVDANAANYAGIASYSAPTAITQIKKETVTIPGTGLVAGGVVQILSIRKGIDALDTMAGIMSIHGFKLKYKVNLYGG
jgi:hypothetical protein